MHNIIHTCVGGSVSLPTVDMLRLLGENFDGFDIISETAGHLIKLCLF